MSGNVQL